MLWQLSNNFKPIFYNQLKNESWIYCKQAWAVGNAVENWMTVICQLIKLVGKMDNILIKDWLKILSQILVIIGLHGYYCEISINPLGKTLMMEFVEIN